MKKQIRNILLFIGMLIGLQQTGYWLGTYQGIFGEQKAIMLRENIDPSVFFYTESKQALQAEKKIRASLKIERKYRSSTIDDATNKNLK